MVNYSSLIEKLRAVEWFIGQRLARDDEPLYSANHMAVMARAAFGGAVAIRANGPADITAINNLRELFLQRALVQDIQVTGIHLPWQRLFEIGFNTEVILP